MNFVLVLLKKYHKKLIIKKETFNLCRIISVVQKDKSQGGNNE